MGERLVVMVSHGWLDFKPFFRPPTQINLATSNAHSTKSERISISRTQTNVGSTMNILISLPVVLDPCSYVPQWWCVFRSSPPDPKTQLKTIIERRPSKASPYAVLDAVYFEIIHRFLLDSQSAPMCVFLTRRRSYARRCFYATFSQSKHSQNSRCLIPTM